MATGPIFATPPGQNFLQNALFAYTSLSAIQHLSLSTTHFAHPIFSTNSMHPASITNFANFTMQDTKEPLDRPSTPPNPSTPPTTTCLDRCRRGVKQL